MMLLGKNWRESITQRTKHILVWYFLINNFIVVGDVTLEHFPLGNIIGYQFTKPLQESRFSKFCAEIQGIPYDVGESDMFWGEPVKLFVPIPQECVGRNGKCTGKILCSNGSDGWDMRPFSNGNNRQDTNL